MGIEAPPRHYTRYDVEQFPTDNLRREIIDGELFVSPSPAVRHQRAVTHIVGPLFLWAREHGGEVFAAPLDVIFAEDTVVEPDVLFIGAEHLALLVTRWVEFSPDIVVEVSSPSTRRLELVGKLEVYERFGVPEYCYVDLDADRIEVYRLSDAVYGDPQFVRPGETLTSPLLPGFALDVADVFSSPPTSP